MEDSTDRLDGLEFCEAHGTDITRLACGKCLSEGPVEPPEPLFPVVGTDITPTPEMIANGRIGNGAWDLTDASLEQAQIEIQQVKKAEKDERRNFFHEKAKDGLADAILFHHRIIKYGLEVMDRVEEPVEDKPVTARDMTILGMAQKSSKELADRGIGRSTAAQEQGTTSTSILTMLSRKTT